MKSIISSTVTLIVSDLGQSVEFYTNIMGFDLIQRYGEHYAEIQAPDLKIGLHPASDKLKKGNNMSLGFSVKDLDGEVATLEAHGLTVKVVPDGWSRIANFSDPDDNGMFMIEMK